MFTQIDFQQLHYLNEVKENKKRKQKYTKKNYLKKVFSRDGSFVETNNYITPLYSEISYETLFSLKQ